jgi:hypothetical protein
VRADEKIIGLTRVEASWLRLEICVKIKFGIIKIALQGFRSRETKIYKTAIK